MDAPKEIWWCRHHGENREVYEILDKRRCDDYYEDYGIGKCYATAEPCTARRYRLEEVEGE